jgi:hypothetical protein
VNINGRIQALQQYARIPRDIILEDAPDFVAWRLVLPNGFERWSTWSQLFAAFQLWLMVTDAGHRDYWRFIGYQSRNELRPANRGKYPINPTGFIRFLEKEPGRTIGNVAGALVGYAALGPVGALVGGGAARGTQEALASDSNVAAGAAKGAVSGYGAALGALAPLLGIVVPGSGGTAAELGRRLSRAGRDDMSVQGKVNELPPKYRKLLNALIEVESSGDPSDVSPSGTYVGLLQMGPDAAEDIGLDNYKGALIGNASLAISSFWKYQALYKSRTGGHPILMAMLWKGGPGTVKTFLNLVQAGATPAQALRDAAPPSWKLPEYMRRVARAYG